MDLNCIFYVTHFDGKRVTQVPEAKVMLRGSSITGLALNSHFDVDDFIRDPLRIGSIAIPKSDPVAWMRALPHVYGGSYLRAELRDANGKPVSGEGDFDPGGALYKYLPKEPVPASVVRAAEAAVEVEMQRTAKNLDAVSPPGWRGTTEHMKDHPEITNPYALAWWQYKRGETSHVDEPPATPKVHVSRKTAKARQKSLAKKKVKSAADGLGPGAILRNSIREKALGVAAKAYKLSGCTSFQGLPISIETKKGERRSGTNHDGTPWSVLMPADYGYIKGTKGVDGDEVDCFIGPHKDAKFAYIFHIENDADHSYDEDKCFLGYKSDEEAMVVAKQAYDNWDKIYRSTTMLPMWEFTQKVLHTGELKKPGKIHAGAL